MNVRNYAIQYIKNEAEALMGLIPLIDDNFDNAVELMFRCHGKVIVTGVGKSGHIGAKIATTLRALLQRVLRTIPHHRTQGRLADDQKCRRQGLLYQIIRNF